GSLAPTGNHHVRVTALNDLVCVANRMSAGGAGSCSGFIGTFGAIPDAYVAGSQVHDGSRNEKRRYFARTALQQGFMFALNYVKSTHAGADMHAHAGGVFGRHLQP